MPTAVSNSSMFITDIFFNNLVISNNTSLIFIMRKDDALNHFHSLSFKNIY